jgi:PAS domain S-box-containing protein
MSVNNVHQVLRRLISLSHARRLLEFFLRNPYVVDTASGLAQWTGEREELIEQVLSTLSEIGIVRRLGDTDLFTFSPTSQTQKLIEELLSTAPQEESVEQLKTSVEGVAPRETAVGEAEVVDLGGRLDLVSSYAVEALSKSSSPSQFLRSLCDLFSSVSNILECAFLVRPEVLGVPETMQMPSEQFIVTLYAIGNTSNWMLRDGLKVTTDVLAEIARQGCRLVTLKSAVYPYARMHGWFSSDVETLAIAPLVIDDVAIGMFVARGEGMREGGLKVCELLTKHAAIGIKYWQVKLQYERISSYTRNLLESVNVGVVALDSEGRIATFNSTAERIFGLSARQAMGVHFKDAFASAFNPRLVGLIERVLEFGESIAGVELEHLNQVGQLKTLNLSLAPIRSERGEPIGVVMVVDDITEARRRREALYRVLPRHVADRIMDSPTSLVSGGVKRRITVLFADMHGFTAISERLTPEQVVDLLNAFLPMLASITFRYEGTVDKFLGDGMMAFFGAPESHEDDAWRAVRAAWEMREATAELAKGKSGMGLRFLTVGIGINTGDAIVGYIGSERVRIEFTAVGDTVNVAKRLQEMAIGDQILMSDTTYELVHDKVIARELGAVTVSGRRKPVFVFQLEGLR